MKALTLWRPWEILVVSGIKRVENRPWSPGKRLAVGERFAIHAGQKWDVSCIPMAQRLGIPFALFGGKYYPQSIVGVVTFLGCVEESDDPWFFGPFGWLLADPVAFDPVPCRGAQGLWALPVEVEAEVSRRTAR